MKAYLEPEEVDILEQAGSSFRDQLLVHVLFRLGCRISEALAIEVRHIDFEQGTVAIEHLKSRMRLDCPKCGARLGKTHAYCPRCGEQVSEAIAKETQRKRMRVLPLDNETLAMLKDYVKRGGPVTKDGKRLLFGINRHRAWQIVRECALRAGLPDLINPETGGLRHVSPHRLRDSFSVNAVKIDDSGDGLRMLQEHLGHASFNTTAKYRKISGDEHRAWYQRLWVRNGKA